MVVMSESGFIDFYKVLNVPTNAEPKQIRLAFVRLAKQHHPDVGGSTREMQKFVKAYRTLIDVSSRSAYDALHKLHSGATPVGYRYAEAPAGTPGGVNDEYVDMFIDQLYNEVTALRSQTKKRSVLSRLFNKQ